MDMTRCPRCAKQIPVESRFCRRCGCCVVRSGGVAGFGVSVPRPAIVTSGVKAGTPSVPAAKGTGELPLFKSGSRMPSRGPCKTQSCGGGGGIGLFVLIAIVAALIAMNSARRANRRRPAPLPPPRPVERYLDKARSTSSRLSPADLAPWTKQEREAGKNQSSSKVFHLHWERVESGAQSTRMRLDAAEVDRRIDAVVRRAKEWLEQIEADRGAVHKSKAGVSPPGVVGEHP